MKTEPGDRNLVGHLTFASRGSAPVLPRIGNKLNYEIDVAQALVPLGDFADRCRQTGCGDMLTDYYRKQSAVKPEKQQPQRSLPTDAAQLTCLGLVRVDATASSWKHDCVTSPFACETRVTRANINPCSMMPASPVRSLSARSGHRVQMWARL